MGDYQAPTPAEFAQWLTPRAALMRIGAHFGDAGMAERAIDGRLKGGRIRAATLRVHSAALPGPGWVYVIPPNQWEHLAIDHADWWDTGDIRICVPPGPRDAGAVYRHFDVRFDPVDVAALLAGAPPKLQLATSPSQAGRPRKDFWDDLVIATMKAVWEGSLQVTRQADVERWMLDWASRNGHAIGETSVKAPAKKILTACAREGQKVNF
jgi:hypothetical protein